MKKERGRREKEKEKEIRKSVKNNFLHGTECFLARVAQPVKFPASYRKRKFTTVFTRARHWSLLSHINPGHTLPPYLPTI
jgi:hypothetical protein